jgi:uncharacterized membrane protein (UPF0127 family)
MRYPPGADFRQEQTLQTILTPPFRALLAATMAALALAAPPALGQAKAALPVTGIKVGGHALRVEIVSTPERRAKGLMFREKLAKNDGMLFIFDEPGYHAMWMMNTLIPLSVAFVDGEGRILNIQDMEPKTLDSHAAAGPARYAIETNQGWFAERGIKAGEKVTGLPKPPR